MKNVDNINDVLGEFNALVQDKVLIVLNEMLQQTEQKSINNDKLKSLITEKDRQIN